MKMENYDVVVVGAGPAGATLAHLLAKSGASVALVEQHFSLDREFRGPGFQPSALKIFDEMGLLQEIEKIVPEKLEHLRMDQQGIPFITIDLKKEAPAPYNYIAVMPQGPLLNLLVQKAAAFPNFHYYGGFAVTGLYQEEGKIAGVVGTHEGEAMALKARVSIGADGRYSLMRKAAGIQLNERDSTFDIVWFLLKAEGENLKLMISLEQGGVTVLIPKDKGLYQAGWLIPKGSFSKIREGGIASFRNQVAGANPQLKKAVEESLQDFNQCHLLNVMVAEAEEWVKDGLLLIGDAAHIASPVGAQGNALAVQDAATAHALLINLLKNKKGILSKADLSAFENTRRSDVEEILAFQLRAAKMLQGKGSLFRKLLLKIISKTPLIKKFSHRILFGVHSVSVLQESFQKEENAFALMKVEKIVEEVPGVKSLYFEKTLPFTPGQYITLRVFVNGTLETRCYSLSSMKALRITPKKLMGGIVSTYLNEQVKEGDTLLVMPPQGRFFSEKHLEGKKRVLCIAGGSGITPMIAILQSLLEKGMDCTLVYANKDPASTIFAREIENFPKEHFTYIPAFSSDGTRLTKERMQEIFQTALDSAIYLCGPTRLQDMVLEVAKEEKIDVHVEKFSSERAVKEVHALQKKEGEPLTVGSGDTGQTEELELILNGEKKSCKPVEDETVLDTALRANIKAPYSCKQGVCAACKAKLTSGKVQMENFEALSSYDVETDFILTCQAKPLTKKVSVDFDL